MGIRQERESFSRGVDSRKISRDSPGRWLPCVSGPHGKTSPVGIARHRKEDRDPADRELRDVAGQFGERPLFCASRGEILRSWQDRSRPGDGLSSSQRDGPGGNGALAFSKFELRTESRGYGDCRRLFLRFAALLKGARL